MKYVIFNKDGYKILYEGFVYVKSKALKFDISYEYEMVRRTKQCNARLHPHPYRWYYLARNHDDFQSLRSCAKKTDETP